MNFKGRIFVLISADRSHVIKEIIEERGGILKDNVTQKTDYVIYGGTDTKKYEKAVELNNSGKAYIKFLTCEEFFEEAFDFEKDVKSIICRIEGLQDKNWIQSMVVAYLTMPLEEAKLFFEVLNRCNDFYSDDYLPDSFQLNNLKDELDTIHSKCMEARIPGVSYSAFDVSTDPYDPYNSVSFYDWETEDNSELYKEVFEGNDNRYESVEKYFYGQGSLHNLIYVFDKKTIKYKEVCWVEQTRVEEEEWREKTTGGFDQQVCYILFEGPDLPVDIDDEEVVSVFGTGKAEAILLGFN